jgi:hypothetical protein
MDTKALTGAHLESTLNRSNIWFVPQKKNACFSPTDANVELAFVLPS